MEALSIQQPWVDRILYEGKDIENRTWCLPRRMLNQRIALHASKRPMDGIPYPADRCGALLGEATITGCVTHSDSPWFDGPYGFVLSDVVAYREPIPMSGRLGFWEVPAL